jgi:hypothetical protein
MPLAMSDVESPLATKAAILTSVRVSASPAGDHTRCPSSFPWLARQAGAWALAI